MASAVVAEYLVTDDLTILLGLVAATVFLLNNLYKPQPLVHPILLGRQSDAGRVRNPGESAVYRNYATGIAGRFPLRPNKDTHILADFVKSDFEGPRTLWSTRLTNQGLQDRVASFGTGLIRLAGLRPQNSHVLLLLNDSIEFVISDLALASHAIQSHTLSSATLVSHVFETYPPAAIITNAELLPRLLELIYDTEDKANLPIIVVGEPSPRVMASVASNIKLLNFADVEREGVRVEKIISPLPNPSEVYTVSFFETESGHVHGAQFTHENMTAGVAATRALLPLSYALTSQDTIVSAYSMSTAYGRAIAYTAIFEGTSVATLNSSRLYHSEERSIPADIDLADAVSYKIFPIPSPTILFLKPGHLQSSVASITKEASKSWLYSFARRHKLVNLDEGYVTKDSLWDRLVFDNARATVIGEGAGTVRGVIISGGPLNASMLTPARMALSVPLINSYTHPLVPGPVLASHSHDLQDFSEMTPSSQIAHVGPPSVNTEVKLVGVKDESIEAGGDPSGMMLMRGPSVGALLRNGDYVSIPTEDEKDGWVATGVQAKIQTNGSFQILS